VTNVWRPSDGCDLTRRDTRLLRERRRIVRTLCDARRMSRYALLLLGAGSLAGLVVTSSCGSGQAPGGPDADLDAPVATLTYTPTGCGYTVSPPASRGYVDLALDDTSAPSGDITPARVRLGLGGGTDSSNAATYANPGTTAAFTWETPTPSHAAKVKVGTTPTTLTDIHAGYTWTTPIPTIGLHSTSPKYMHEVHVCGLSAGTTYYYQVGGGPAGSEVWSATQSFTTVPGTGTITVGVLGDARDTISTWQLVHERMLNAGVAVQLIGGDIVDIGTMEDLWTQWLDAIWKDPNDATKFVTLGQQLMLPIAGNHENESSQFYANWAIPGDGDYAESYASFDVGNTHFVLFDDQFVATQQGGSAAAAQLAWLTADLDRANKNRASVPFIVLVSHRGLYSTSLHSADGDVLLARGTLAPIFDKYAVDLVINGHDHEYERSKPLMAGNPPAGQPVVGTGTTYVICAGAGADPYSVGTAASTYRQLSVPFGTSTPYIGAYGILTLSANTLRLDAYGLKASGTDDVIDTLQLLH